MTALDDLPVVNSFLGLDLRTGCLIIAAIGIIHPMAYGCSFFVPMSYLLVTIWVLVALFFAANVVLFCGIVKEDALLLAVWVWYAVIFVVVMLMMMILLALLFTSRKQKNRVCVVIVGILWYMLTIYFIVVVNSQRKVLLSGADKKSDDVSGEKPQALRNTLPALLDEAPVKPPTRTPPGTDTEDVDNEIEIDDKARLL